MVADTIIARMSSRPEMNLMTAENIDPTGWSEDKDSGVGRAFDSEPEPNPEGLFSAWLDWSGGAFLWVSSEGPETVTCG